jgi:hypothetical protein
LPGEGASAPWEGGWWGLIRDQWDKYRVDPIHEPAFFVYIDVDASRYEELVTSEALEHWRAALARPRPLGPPAFEIVSPPGEGTLVARPLYLAELATRASTLDGQADHLATFIDESLAYLAAHPPSPEPGPN